MRHWKVHVVNDWARNSFQVIPFYEDDVNGIRIVYFFKDGEWQHKEFPVGERIPDDFPFLYFHKDFAVKLVDVLLEHIRPSGPTATEQELKATKIHLEDMRALTFGKLMIDAPKEKEKLRK